MKKYILSIVGVLIQFLGIGLMLLNINNDNKTYFWIGLPLVFIGMFLAIMQVFINSKKK